MSTCVWLYSDADINIFAADEIATGVLQPNQNNETSSNHKMTMNDFRSDVSLVYINYLYMSFRNMFVD